MDPALAYRNKSTHLSSDDDDSDSSGGGSEEVWKRSSEPKVPQELNGILSAKGPVIPNDLGCGKKRKVNTVWSSVLLEQSVSEDLGLCGLKRKPITFESRASESYDFTQKEKDDRPLPSEGEGSMDAESEEEDDTEEPQGKPKRPKALFTNKMKRFRLSKADLVVSRKIIRVLHEPKRHLIEKIVHTIGSQKALQLMKMTEDVEDSGGMMILNGKRRRTPGGVYLQLLKSDKTISRNKKNIIFEDDYDFKKKRPKFKKQKSKAAKVFDEFVIADSNEKKDAEEIQEIHEIEDVEDGEIVD